MVARCTPSVGWSGALAAAAGVMPAAAGWPDEPVAGVALNAGTALRATTRVAPVSILVRRRGGGQQHGGLRHLGAGVLSSTTEPESSHLVSLIVTRSSRHATTTVGAAWAQRLNFRKFARFGTTIPERHRLDMYRSKA